MQRSKKYAILVDFEDHSNAPDLQNYSYWSSLIKINIKSTTALALGTGGAERLMDYEISCENICIQKSAVSIEARKNVPTPSQALKSLGKPPKCPCKPRKYP